MVVLFLMLSCSQEHTHEELVQKVELLEQKVMSQDKKIQQLLSVEIQKKKVAPLCVNEQPDVYVLMKNKFETLVSQADTRPRVYPHQKDGEIIGLRIANVPEEWKSCGLDDGDLLLSLNDVRLRTPRTLQGYTKERIHFLSFG